jgi:hypothetical protein
MSLNMALSHFAMGDQVGSLWTFMYRLPLDCDAIDIWSERLEGDCGFDESSHQRGLAAVLGGDRQARTQARWPAKARSERPRFGLSAIAQGSCNMLGAFRVGQTNTGEPQAPGIDNARRSEGPEESQRRSRGRDPDDSGWKQRAMWMESTAVCCAWIGGHVGSGRDGVGASRECLGEASRDRERD